MGKPKAPEPTNPALTAAASNSTNIGTAIANTMMGNVNQVTPNGSLTYDQTGNYDWKDPFTGRTYSVPTFTATQTLSPQQQAIQDQNQQAQKNLAGIANDRSAWLSDYFKAPVDTSGVPGLATSAGQSGTIGGGYSANFGQNVGGSYNSDFSGNVGGGFNPAFNGTIGGSYSDKLGGGYSDSVDLAKSYAGADDFSADRQRVEDALWDRSANQRAQADEGLRTRLLNSGIREGSAAWNSEMQRMAAQNTDARLATVAAASQEQSRMVGLAQQAAQFGNDATLAQAQFGNTAAGNRMQLENAASLGQAQFGQQAQQAQNAAALAQAQYGREGQQAGNAASLAQAQYAQQAQQAQNSAALAQGQYSNAANATNAQFQNAARSQGLQEAYAARNQPLNEVLGLMSGTQISNPNFVNTSTGTIANTDVGGIIGNYDQQRMNAYQQQQQSMGGLIGGIGSGIGSMLGAPSGSILGGLMGFRG
ncbi:tail fiber domain-containing protein [Xanthobacteraceae bacterium A53D]